MFKRNQPPYSQQEIADFLVAVDGDIIRKREKATQRAILAKNTPDYAKLLRIVDGYNDAEMAAIEYLRYMLKRNKIWTERQNDV